MAPAIMPCAARPTIPALFTPGRGARIAVMGGEQAAKTLLQIQVARHEGQRQNRITRKMNSNC